MSGHRACATCGEENPKNLVCSGCKSVWYCGDGVCQKWDWVHGGHKQVCKKTRASAVERAMVRDLIDLEVAFLKDLSQNTRKMMNRLDENSYFKINHYLSVGKIALVLTRMLPSMIVDATNWRPYGKRFHDSVAKPWSEKYEGYLSENGFEFDFLPYDGARTQHKDGVANDIGGLLIFKDARNKDIDSLYTEPLCGPDLLAKCLGNPSKNYCSCGGETCDLEKPVGNVSYDLLQAHHVFKLPARNICCSSCVDFPEVALSYAESIGEHFRRCRDALLPLGLSISLDITTPDDWTDDALVTTWMAAAGGDAKTLLAWTRPENNIIQAHKLKDVARLKRIFSRCNKLSV